MGIISYAQNFEDVMLWRALSQVEKGFYIDVGAFHPITDSVSKLFYEQGWRGIHVEPLPQMAALIRADRPDEPVIQSVVSDTNGISKLYDIYGLSTGIDSIAQMHQRNGIDSKEISVPCVTMDDIFEYAKGKEIHWLKVDVEGMEKKVLSGWKSKVLPWIAVVESTIPNSKEENWQEWEPLLTKKGYEFVFFDGLNRYYVSPKHPELKAAFYAGPNIFDQFHLHGDSSAPFCNYVNEQARKREAALQLSVTERQSALDNLQQILSEREGEYTAREQELLKQATIKDAEHQRLAEGWLVREESLQQSLDHTRQAAQREISLLREESALRDTQLTAVITGTRQELVGKATELAAAQQTIASLQQANTLLQQTIIDLNHSSAQQVHALRHELACVQATVSWKMTAPLRGIAQLFSVTKLPAYTSGNDLTKFAGSAQILEKNDAGIKSIKVGEAMTIENVQQLLDLHGVAFIEATYGALLNRGADPQGRQYYLKRLQAGYSKAEIIYQMTCSGEYKAIRLQLRGLPELCNEQKRAAGGFFKRDRTTERQINRLEYTLSSQIEKLRAELLQPSKMQLAPVAAVAQTNGSVLAKDYDNLPRDPSGMMASLEKRIVASEEAFVLSKL